MDDIAGCSSFRFPSKQADLGKKAVQNDLEENQGIFLLSCKILNS